MKGLDSSLFVLVLLFGGLILAAMVAIVGGFLHARRDRLLSHAERMKALELGRELPDDPATARIKAAHQAEEPTSQPNSPNVPKSLAVQCFTNTGLVAGCGLFFATFFSGNPGVSYAVAASAGAIGVTGMICGTILAIKLPESIPSTAPIKPRFDPEAV